MTLPSRAEAVELANGVPTSTLIGRLQKVQARVPEFDTYNRLGWVRSVKGMVIYAAIGDARLGQIFIIHSQGQRIMAEVIGIENEISILSAFDRITGVKKGAIIQLESDGVRAPIGAGLLGRVVGPLGEILDGEGDLKEVTWETVQSQMVPAMQRPLITEPLSTGIRAIDGTLLLGRGQRIGIFGPPGVGKSNLLSALARNTEADVIVIGLIGERAREVREFVERHLPPEEREKIVCIVSTSDRPPSERLYAAHTANRAAEYFRDQGKAVLLLMDSLTRVARAVREIGMSAGEPPARRGYPASVYSTLPGIIERAGTTKAGSITALYTVLTEGEISEDPIAEELRSLTDGHIILSRDLAEKSHYPAIDVLSSISRLMSDIAEEQHVKWASKLRRLLHRYSEVEMLIQIGEYQPGNDKELDEAVSCYPEIMSLLQQETQEFSSIEETLEYLEGILV